MEETQIKTNLDHRFNLALWCFGIIKQLESTGKLCL